MDIANALERTMKETLSAFDLPDRVMDARPSPGKWTIRQLLHHITDAETVLFERIKRTICEERPTITAFAQEHWAERLHYDKKPLQPARKIFVAVREAMIVLAVDHYEKDGNREFIHNEMGVRTLRQEFDKVVTHNQQHLEQIGSIREKL